MRAESNRSDRETEFSSASIFSDDLGFSDNSDFSGEPNFSDELILSDESNLSGAPPRLFDMHCHLDFGEDPQALAADLARLNIECLSATVTPDTYLCAAQTLSVYSNVHVGLGLHPWWVTEGKQGQAALDLFCQLLAQAHIVAEVGLDFGAQHAHTRKSQLATFSRIARACAHEGGRVLSIHAIKAATEVLDILQETGALAENACVFHWFSGTSDELTRATRAGCFFSVNPHMLETKRGRAYAKAVPENRLLLETDEPSSPGAPFDALCSERTLKHMISELAALRKTSYDALEAAIARTSAALLA